MKLAYLAKIDKIERHPNADTLSIASVGQWESIIKTGAFQEGDTIIFIQPDTVLPDKPWAKSYKLKNNRVRSIKIRNLWSIGIILPLSILEEYENTDKKITLFDGLDVANIIGVIKYEIPMPQDLQAKGGLQYGLPITDECRIENLEIIPYGEICDVTLKIDGKSFTAYAKKEENPNSMSEAELNKFWKNTSNASFEEFKYNYLNAWSTGICGRKLEYKLDSQNHYTLFKDILPKLLEYSKLNNISLAIRGEISGTGIQAHANNPHSKGPIKLSIFSVYLIDEHRYAHKGEPFYFPNVAQALGLQTVDFLEKDVILTKELIYKYSEGYNKINGNPFEGVVIQTFNNSFKVINKDYDSKK